MTNYKHIIYCLIGAIVIALIGCSNKKDELSKLMAGRKYREARSLMKTLTNSELSDNQVLLYRDTLNFVEIDSVILYRGTKNEYLSIDSILNVSINTIKTSTQLKDSITTLREYYAFKGAQYYNSIGANTKAYECLQKYLKKQYFTVEQSQILNQILKDKINGVWKGENASSKKILIAMRLDALTSRSFEGILDFKGDPWNGYKRVIIENGVFDGYELSAQAFMLEFGRSTFYKGQQFTLTGYINKDILHITIDLNSYLIPDGSVEWILGRK